MTDKLQEGLWGPNRRALSSWNFEKDKRAYSNQWKIHSQVGVVESPKKLQEEYLQLHVIKSLQSDRIPVFEAYLRWSNAVVQMSQQLMHLNFPIEEVTKLSYMSGLADTGAGFNLENIDYRQ